MIADIFGSNLHDESWARWSEDYSGWESWSYVVFPEDISWSWARASSRSFLSPY